MIAVVADEDDALLAQEWLQQPADQRQTAAQPTPVTSMQGQVGVDAETTATCPHAVSLPSRQTSRPGCCPGTAAPLALNSL